MGLVRDLQMGASPGLSGGPSIRGPYERGAGGSEVSKMLPLLVDDEEAPSQGMQAASRSQKSGENGFFQKECTLQTHFRLLVSRLVRA